MKNMTIENVVKAVNGKLLFATDMDKSKLNIEAENVVIDSRLATENSIFIATKGERVDGITFVKSVFEKGALAAIVEKIPDGEYGPCILVEDSFKALRDIAEYYRSNLSVKVVGITGSVGKTSTKEFIAGVLAEKFDVLKTEGNFNNEVGVPLTILKIRDNHEIAVVEMGINHFGEMTRLSKIAKPDFVVITNIGECHLEFLGDRDGVLKAKTEIFTYMNKNGHVVVNGDDDKLNTLSLVNGNKVIKIGIENSDVDYVASDIVNNGLLGSEFSIKSERINANMSVPLPGKHMIYNALCAAAVADFMDEKTDSIKEGLQKLKSVGGRSNIIKTKDYILVDDCYNANPSSVKSAINMICEEKAPKTVILGDMFELGENEALLHARVGEYAASKDIDRIICIGSLSENTYNAAKKSNENSYWFADTDSAMAEIFDILKKGDVVLIKASHGMAFNKIVEYITTNNI